MSTDEYSCMSDELYMHCTPPSSVPATYHHHQQQQQQQQHQNIGQNFSNCSLSMQHGQVAMQDMNMNIQMAQHLPQTQDQEQRQVNVEPS